MKIGSFRFFLKATATYILSNIIPTFDDKTDLDFQISFINKLTNYVIPFFTENFLCQNSQSIINYS